MDIHVTPTVSWHPHHTWDRSTSHVDGALSDGRQVDVATLNDTEVVDAKTYAAARHQWLHDGLLVLDAAVHGAPTLVVPVVELNDGMIAEAVRRYLRTTPARTAA